MGKYYIELTTETYSTAVSYSNKGDSIVRDPGRVCAFCRFLDDEEDIYDLNDGEPTQ